jgi:lipoyl(octanoyl) transferase
MDLEPFSRINPCGYEGLQVTQWSDWVQEASPAQVADELSRDFKDQLLDLARHRVASEA